MADFFGIVAKGLVAAGLQVVASVIRSKISDKRGLEKPNNDGLRKESKIKGLYANNRASLGDVIPVGYGRMNIVPSNILRKFGYYDAANSFNLMTGSDSIKITEQTNTYTASVSFFSYTRDFTPYESFETSSRNVLIAICQPKVTAYQSLSPNSLLGFAGVPGRNLGDGMDYRNRVQIKASSLLNPNRTDKFIDHIGVDAATANHGMRLSDTVNSAGQTLAADINYAIPITPGGFITRFLVRWAGANYDFFRPNFPDRINAWQSRVYEGIRTFADAQGSKVGFFQIPNNLSSGFEESFTINSFGTVESNSGINWNSYNTLFYGDFANEASQLTGLFRKIFTTGTVYQPLNFYFTNNSTVFPRRAPPNESVASTLTSSSSVPSQLIAPGNNPLERSNGGKNTIKVRKYPGGDENAYKNLKTTFKTRHYTASVGLVGVGAYDTDLSLNNPDRPDIYVGDKIAENPARYKFTQDSSEVFSLPGLKIANVELSPYTTSFDIADQGGRIQAFPFIRVIEELEQGADELKDKIKKQTIYDDSLRIRTTANPFGRMCLFSKSKLFTDFELLKTYSSKTVISPPGSRVYAFTLDLLVRDTIGYFAVDSTGNVVDQSGEAYETRQGGCPGRTGAAGLRMTRGQTVYSVFCILFRAATKDGSNEDNNVDTWNKIFFRHKGTADAGEVFPLYYELTTAQRDTIGDSAIEIRVVRTETYIQLFNGTGYTHAPAALSSSGGHIPDKGFADTGKIQGLAFRQEEFRYSFTSITCFVDRDTLPPRLEDSNANLYMVQEISSVNAESSDLGKLSVTLTRKLPIFDRCSQKWTDNDLRKTRNPIWAIADMIRNTIYGAGRTEPRYINGNEWVELANQLESEGRFYDDLLTTKMSLQETISRVMIAVRGSLYFKNTQFKIMLERQKQDSDLKRIFTDKNIIQGSFSIAIHAKDRTATQTLLCNYYNKDSSYRESTIFINESGLLSSVPEISNNKISNFRFNGITEEARIIEEATHTIRSNKYITLEVNFAVGLDGELLEPGDYIMLALNGWKRCFSSYIQSTQLLADTTGDANPSRTIRIELLESVTIEANKNYLFYYEKPDGRPCGSFNIIGQGVTSSLMQTVGSKMYKNLPVNDYNVIDIQIPPLDSGAADTLKYVQNIQCEMLTKTNEEQTLYLVVQEGDSAEVNEIHRDNFLKLIVVRTQETQNNVITVSCVNYSDSVYG